MDSKSPPKNHGLVPDLKISSEHPASHFCLPEGGKRLLHRVIPLRPATVQFKKGYKYDLCTAPIDSIIDSIFPRIERGGTGREMMQEDCGVRSAVGMKRASDRVDYCTEERV